MLYTERRLIFYCKGGEQALFLYAAALTIPRCKNTQRAFAKAIADQKAGGTPPHPLNFFQIISQCLVHILFDYI